MKTTTQQRAANNTENIVIPEPILQQLLSARVIGVCASKANSAMFPPKWSTEGFITAEGSLSNTAYQTDDQANTSLEFRKAHVYNMVCCACGRPRFMELRQSSVRLARHLATLVCA